MSEIKVEVGQYRAIDKGVLKGSFSLVIYPHGQKILGCKHFEKDGQQWFAFPQLEIKKKDEDKSDYIPYVSYLDKQYLEKLKSAVLEALKTAKPQERNGSNQSSGNQAKQNQIQGDASSVWF